MNKVTYDAGTMTIEVYGLDGVAYMLGDLKSKTPAVVKTAINATARKTARDAVKAAERRYALTTRGEEKLRDYKQRKKATNRDLLAIINGGDDALPLNIVYFEHTPNKPYMGKAIGAAPAHFRARVLRSGGYKELDESSDGSRAFLVSIHNTVSKNDHIAMLQRVLGSQTNRRKTNRGYPRWKSPNGLVEKIYDMERPGVSSMGAAVWSRGVDQTTAEYLQEQVFRQTERVLARAKAKQRLMP